MARGARERSHPGSGGDIVFVAEAPLPADPYNWRWQQWSVLRLMGYPVEVIDVPIHEARETALGKRDARLQPFVDYQLGIFKDWWQPGVLDPKFVPWVESILPDFEIPHITLSQQYDLHNHPAATLPYAVDNGLFKSVKTYLGRVKNEHPIMHYPGNHEGAFKGCYVTAMDRLMERAEIAPFYLEMEMGEYNAVRSDITLYQSLVKNGVRPASSEALGAMVGDFYHMLGSLVPEFSAFQQLKA